MPDRISNTLLFMLIILATFVSGVNDYVEIYFVWSGNAMTTDRSLSCRTLLQLPVHQSPSSAVSR
jgi:hypothetical protein